MIIINLKFVLVFLLVSLALFVSALAPLFDNKLHLVFCDVGQGDGILIYRKQTQILVDAGSDGKILNCLSNHMPFWDRKIEMAVITNADLDHYGGFVDIVRRYDVGAFATNMAGKNDLAFETLENEIEGRNIPVTELNSGRAIVFDQLRLTTLWPTKRELATLDVPAEGSRVLGANTTDKANLYSVVLELSYGDFDALLAGDIVPPSTDMVSQSISDLVEVLKVPHHGSKNGLTQVMLEKAKPQLAVISAGKRNKFKHPHKETLELLAKFGIKTLGTYESGEIEVVTDGKSWRVSKN